MKKPSVMLLLAAVTAAGAAGINIPSDSGAVIRHAQNELRLFTDKNAALTFKLQLNKALASEAWTLVRSAGGPVTVSGGDERGVYYGVLEFLERYAGIRFYGPDHTFVPAAPPTIPRDINVSGKPAFRFRLFSFGHDCARDSLWYARNRIQAPRAEYRHGGFFMYGSPNRCHTFGIYTSRPDFPAKPECFALQKDGSRPAARDGRGPGQPCLSNPEVRAYFLRKLREYIANDRKKAAASKKPAPMIYNVSPNDNDGYCRCGLCRAAWKRTGGPGGLDLDFINFLAAGIESDYPDLTLEYPAYMYSVKPEKIKAHKNVRVQIAQLGHEYGGRRNTLRSLLHPSNAESLSEIRSWKNRASRFAIWDYGQIFEEPFPSPFTEVRGYRDTIGEYRLAGVESVYLESENYWFFNRDLSKKVAFPQSFCELKNYTFCRFLLNPDTDVEALIDEYMRHAYGPAAAYMKRYLDFLEERQNASANMNAASILGRMYMNYEFFVEVEKLLTAAEKAAANSSAILNRIGRERFNVDYAMLVTWRKHLAEKPFPLTRQQILSRLEKSENLVVDVIFPERERGAAGKCGAERRKALSVNAPEYPPPAFLAESRIEADFHSGNFDPSPVGVIVPDKDAFTGKAFKLGDIKVGYYTKIHNSKPFELGIYDMAGKKIIAEKKFPASEQPRDEKYHWYVFRGVPLASRCRMWGHWTWSLTPVKRLEEAFKPGMPMAKFDVWISYKLTGPAYAPMSKNENAAYIDRVVVTSEK